MNGFKKEEVKRDICKNHTIRSDRDLYRVCPSKLSKKELEDLYFTLLEKNLDLKKTVTGQQDQIKLLSTKVQRMTATQKNNVAREKDCCMYTKAMVNEQKESIADLKRANEKMSERIRVLNMRLCSAKQFVKRSPTTSTSRCTKCSAPAISSKNSSVSVLHPKMKESNIKTAVPGQGLDKDVMLSTRTVETETEEPEKENPDGLCTENRCQSLMEELKQKIVDLQEELSKTHNEYSSRISRLEDEVADLRAANDRERAQRAASEHQVQVRGQRADQLTTRLRDAEAKYGELSTELSVEKRKVAELETRVKAAGRATAVAKTIQEHLDSINQIVKDIDNQKSKPASPNVSPRWDNSPRDVRCESPCQPLEATDKPCSDKDESTEKAAQHRLSKLSDDSGYIEAYRSPKVDDNKPKNIDSNEELTNRIAHLQKQINDLTSCMKTNDYAVPKEDERKSLTSGACSRVVDTPIIKIERIPVSDTCIRKTLEGPPVLKMPGSYSEPKPDDMMALLDNEPNAQKMTVTQKSDKPNDASVNTPTLEKRIKYEDANIDPATEKAERDSFVNKDIIPTHLDLPKDLKTQTIKDTHNKFQIPGPIPGDNIPRVSDKIVDRFRKRHSTVKCIRQSKDTVIRAREVNKLQGFVKESGVENLVRIKDDVDEENKNITPDKNKEDVERNLDVRLSTAKDVVSPAKATTGTLMEKYIENEADDGVPSSSTIIPTIPDKTDDAQQNRLELCLHHTRLCTCNGAKRRDVSVFRTCSGTLRFRTTPSPAAPTFKRCGCAAGIDYDGNVDVYEKRDQATQVASDPLPPSDEPRPRSATYSKGQTYPIPPQSPDNTDCEISSLTDLPSEKDDKSPRDALSPGEDKGTSTYTDSYCTPHTTPEYSTLSEGELPAAGGARKLSEGETKGDSPDKKQARVCPGSRARMEEALAAVSGELALCRDLLRARRASQLKRPSKDASQTADLCPAPIALKRAAGTPRIGDAFTPKCMFTLHVGTVVLSDEAVINSRDMSLVLTWKFYDQSMTMTRMRASRVMLFDFSTEYDIKITDHFLDYLKYENMQIIISDIDKQEEPFASCALPLRDALLHANRRADMSLALVAGPNLQPTHDPLDSGDEVGVLDLWCMLRVDPALLPAINRAIARSTPPNPTSKEPVRTSTCMQQLMEDDRYNDDHISQDLNIRPSGKPKVDYDYGPIPKQKTGMYDFEPQNPIMKQKADMYDFEPPPSPIPKQKTDMYDFEPPPSPITKQKTDMYDFEPQNRNMKQKADMYDFESPPSPITKQRTNMYDFEPQNRIMKQKSEIFDFEPPQSHAAKQKTDIYDFVVPDNLATKQRSELYDVSRQPSPPDKVHSATNDGQNREYTNMSTVRDRHRSIASQIGYPGGPQSTNPLRRSVTRSQVGFKDAEIQSVHSKIIVNEVPAQIKSANDMKQALDRNALHEQTLPLSRLGRLDDDAASQTHSVGSYWRGLVAKRQIPKSSKRSSFTKKETSLTNLPKKVRSNNMSPKGPVILTPPPDVDEPPELTKSSRGQNGSKKSVTIASYKDNNKTSDRERKISELNEREPSDLEIGQSVEITVMWLALNEECDAMLNPTVQRLYVAYSFLGRSGADMETPVSLTKPKSYVDKCYFHFTKKFQLSDCDLPLLGHMARCRSTNRKEHNAKDCAIFTVVSEPPEDPLGLDSCEDIGYAYLYFGDLLAYSAGNDSYTEVVPVQSAHPNETVCGVLAVKVDGLDVLRRCTLLATSQWELTHSLY